MGVYLLAFGFIGAGLSIGLGTGDNKAKYGDFAIKLLIASMLLAGAGATMLDFNGIGG